MRLGPWRSKNCLHCGRDFFASHTNGVFCSKVCKERARKHRRYIAAEEKDKQK